MKKRADTEDAATQANYLALAGGKFLYSCSINFVPHFFAGSKLFTYLAVTLCARLHYHNAF